MKGQRRKDADRQAAQAAQQVRVHKQITYPDFLIGQVRHGEDGSKVISFITPGGEMHLFPLAKEPAQQLGQELLSPSVEIAGAGDMPPPPVNGSKLL